MPKGSITDLDREFVETWENISPSWNAIIKLDRRGDEYQEVIQERRTFMVTTEERLMLEDRVLDQKNNPFRNGSFRPVLVPDSVSIDSNPNALSDDEIVSVLVSSDLAWDEWMTVIDSSSTVQRMVELAETTDKNVSLKRYQQLKARLTELRPKTQITDKNRAQLEAIGDRNSAASNRGGRTRQAQQDATT